MQDPGCDVSVVGLAAGDERAFSALYDRYVGRLFRAASGMLGRREDAEDAVQDVFCDVYRSRLSLIGVQDFEAYLFTVLRMAVARCAARRGHGVSEPVDVMDEVPAPSGLQSGSNSYSDRLERALSVLPLRQREVVALKIDGELTFTQIAQVLGVSINTASSRYRYAMDKLRDSLKPLAVSLGNRADEESGYRRQMLPGQLTNDRQEVEGSSVDEKLRLVIRPGTA